MTQSVARFMKVVAVVTAVLTTSLGVANAAASTVYVAETEACGVGAFGGGSNGYPSCSCQASGTGDAIGGCYEYIASDGVKRVSCSCTCGGVGEQRTCSATGGSTYKKLLTSVDQAVEWVAD